MNNKELHVYMLRRELATSEDVDELIHALRVAMVVISQHYPEGEKCCESKLEFILQVLKKYGG